MPEHETSPRALRRFGLSLAIILVALILLVVIAVFLPRKPSPAAAALDTKLTQLRADGVPLSIEELAKAFPDPPSESDGRIVLRNALASAPRGGGSPLLPFVGGPMPPRSDRISDAVMQALSSRLSNSDEILKSIPDKLDDVWFSTGWAQGAKSQTPFAEIRYLELTLALKAIYESELGNRPNAAEALKKGFAVCAMLRSDSLVNTMIGVACAGVTCDAAEQAVNRVKFEEQHLIDIGASLPVDAVGSFEGAFTAERGLISGYLDALRAAHNGLSEDRLRLVWWRLMHIFDRSRPLYRDEDYLLFLNVFDEMSRLHTKPLLQRARELEVLTAQFKTNAQSEVVSRFFPNVTKAMSSAGETKSRLVALKTALAIEHFRLANSNALPASLDVLAPKYCSSPPRDPFDEQPLRYKKLARGYVVYSIGADGVDNGGVERGEKKADYDVTIIVER